jgi:hypothetical protein
MGVYAILGLNYTAFSFVDLETIRCAWLCPELLRLLAFDKIMPLDRIWFSLTGNWVVVIGRTIQHCTVLGGYYEMAFGLLTTLEKEIYLNQIRLTPEAMVRNLYNLSIGHVIPHFAQSAKEIT